MRPRLAASRPKSVTRGRRCRRPPRPPSVHASDDRYTWVTPNVQPPEAPDWLVQLALPPEPPPAVALALPVGRQIGERYAAAAISGECRAVPQAPVGARNHRLNLAAWRLGRLAATGVVDEAVAREALLAAAAACGLPHHESIGTVRSGMTAGLRNPRRLRPSAPDTRSAAPTAARRRLTA